MTRVTLIVLFVFSFALYAKAQDSLKIGFAGMQKKQLKYGSTLKRILKKNSIDVNEFIRTINNQLLLKLSANFQVTDLKETEFVKLFDEMEYDYSLTSEYTAKIGKKNNVSIMFTQNDNSNTNTYVSVQFTPDIRDSLVNYLSDKDFHFLVLINSLWVYKNHMVGELNDVILHYEVFDSKMNKVYGGKSEMQFTLSSKVYFSTFKFYFNKIADDYHLKMIKHLQLNPGD